METQPHVLLVEDEPAMLYILQATVDFGGLTSDIAGTGAEALRILEAGAHDVVVTDLGLPDGDGGLLIEAIRKKHSVPIIVVSGHDSEQEKIRVLDLGADDFLAKPFLPGELLARIRAVLRRAATAPADKAPLSADAFLHPGLAPFERRLFELLAEREDELVTNEEIFDAVWGEEKSIVNLRVLVTHLRQKLEKNNASVKISNQRGTGYSLTRV